MIVIMILCSMTKHIIPLWRMDIFPQQVSIYLLGTILVYHSKEMLFLALTKLQNIRVILIVLPKLDFLNISFMILSYENVKCTTTKENSPKEAPTCSSNDHGRIKRHTTPSTTPAVTKVIIYQKLFQIGTGKGYFNITPFIINWISQFFAWYFWWWGAPSFNTWR